jgi:hypothetical protein
VEYLVEYVPAKIEKVDIRKYSMRKKHFKQPLRNKYKAYIRSDKWIKRRDSYYAKFGKSCAICQGLEGVGLHHIIYKNLGKEKDKDLLPICQGCVPTYYEKRGLMSLEEICETTQFAEIIKQLDLPK